VSLDFNSIIQNFHLTSLFKVGILAVLFLYILFLFVIFRQVRSMDRVIVQSFLGHILEIFAVVLLLIGIALFAAALAIL